MNYGPVLDQIVGLCENNIEKVHRPSYFVEKLDLDVNPRSLGISLATKFKEIGFLRLHKKEKRNPSYYGISEVCGSRECFESWCRSESVPCKIGAGNEKLEFVK